MMIPIVYKSAGDALAVIESGNRVYLHGSAQTPTYLLRALKEKNVNMRDILVGEPTLEDVFISLAR